MQIELYEYSHEGGTKNYHIVRLDMNGKAHLVVRRFGKIGAAGQLKVTEHSTAISAVNDCVVEGRRREKKGYTKVNEVNFTLDGDWKDRCGRHLNDAAFLNRLEQELHRRLGSDFMLHTMTEPEPEPEPVPDIERGELWGSW